MPTSIYLETSVVGAYLDKGESFRRDLTIRWWEHELKHYQAYVSPLVQRELERIRELGEPQSARPRRAPLLPPLQGHQAKDRGPRRDSGASAVWKGPGD